MLRWTMLTLTLGTLVVLALAAGPGAAAPPNNFVAHLQGGNEVPAVSTRAQGQAIFHLNAAGTALTYTLIVANIENVVAAHIHLAPAGANGPVVAFLFGPAAPSGRVQGPIASGTLTAANLIGPLAGQPLSALIAAMQAGNTYVNVHTSANPPGEIRGQIR